MDPTLGARLRAYREERQISLEAVSTETKIKLCMLEGLENDDVSQWPDGIYRRAYIRAYARVVGLPPEGLVREFLDAHPDPVLARQPEETELENPAWPAELSRFLNSARAVVPALHGKNGSTSAPLAGVPTRPPEQSDNAQPSPMMEAVLHPTETTQRPEPNLVQAADMCARLSRALHRAAVAAVLEDAAAALGAAGVVVWSWNPRKAGLTPAIAHGYDDGQLAAMACVRADADNGIAVAFRSTEPCVIARGENSTGAVTVPIMSLGECVGVLAIEFADGHEESDSVRAFAAVLAAQLVPHLSAPRLAAAANA